MESKLDFGFATMQSVLRKIAAIDAFQSRWQIEQADEKAFLKQAKAQTMYESTGSSTRIEGSTLTNLEVESLLKNMKITELKTRDEQEVAGYYEVLQLVLDNYKAIPLSESYIGQLHGLLLRHSAKDQRHRGAYKALTNQVVARSPMGTERIVFNTTLPHLTPAAMQDLVKWANESFEKDELHPLLTIVLFIYEFLSIHPFQDGNGRLSRLMTTLLLLQYGYDFVLYTSFENLIEENKKDYYRVLMAGQGKRNKSDVKETIEEWVIFFLDSLLTLTHRLTEKRQIYFALKGYLNERQKQVLASFDPKESLQLSDLLRLLPTIPRATLKRDLTILTEKRLLIQVGSGRGIRYFLSESKLPIE